jgi:hydrogenase expression/formation protein HypC
MCLGVPGRVVQQPKARDELAMAVVEFAGVRRPVCLACVPEVAVGDYVIVHAGFALSRIDPIEAERVLEHLKEMGELEEWRGASLSNHEVPQREMPP